ncbi:class I histocompatibility antigen, F10 alpha chain-like isoform X3 [Alosa pseudoharengus]|uniref:class I histocompatibility antigen, F10 alpha chain-like isoform X3 n=1 Tax=Alosa pseudoharengus TaxID=34774 RepID=UPI003F8B428F
MGLITLVVFVGVILPSLNALPGMPDRHSLYYVYTALSKPVSAPGVFEFTGMGVLDNRKIDYYNSVDKMKIPQQNWMREKLPADYWEKGTQSRRSKEQWFKVNVNILMERKRQNNSDVHVLNWRHGCVVDKFPDGRVQFIKGADEYSYDGRDFLSFDDASMQWIAPVNEAVQTKQKWDGVPILNQYTKGYLEKECVDWLDKFITYADAELKGSIPPKVYLFARTSKESADKLTMTCLATGFLPKDIEMFIKKGGSIVEGVSVQDVYPNGDGTHQARLVVNVPKSEANDYQCSVNHRTLQAPEVRTWETDGLVTDETSSIGVIAGGAAGGAVVLIALIAGLVVMIKKKGTGKTIERNGYEQQPIAGKNAHEQHPLKGGNATVQDAAQAEKQPLNENKTREKDARPAEKQHLAGKKTGDSSSEGSQDSGLNTPSPPSSDKGSNDAIV